MARVHYRRKLKTRKKSRTLGRTVGLGLVFAASSAFAQTATDDIALPPVDVRALRRGEYRVNQSELFKLPDPLKDIPQSMPPSRPAEA